MCKKQLNDQFVTTIFSDETIFQFYRTKAKQWTKHGKSRKPVPKHSPDGTFCGGISSRGKTPPSFVYGTIDVHKHCEVLEQHLLEFAINFWDGWRFQQNNAPLHRTKITPQWLRKHNIDVLDWPSYRPVLNPIEHYGWPIKNAMESQEPWNLEVGRKRL